MFFIQPDQESFSDFRTRVFSSGFFVLSCHVQFIHEVIMQAKAAPKIILFTTPTCSYCTLAKRYFNEQRIRFKEVDVSRNKDAAMDLQKRTGQMGVPVILINNKPIVGFDKSKINKILGLR